MKLEILLRDLVSNWLYQLETRSRKRKEPDRRQAKISKYRKARYLIDVPTRVTVY